MTPHTITPAVGVEGRCKPKAAVKWRAAVIIEAFTTRPPQTNTIIIIAPTESTFVALDDLVPFHCSSIPSCITPLQRRRQWIGVIGSTRNGRRDTRCRSARHLAMV
ncbi:hypothetical protein TNCV_2117031 [Trichonephila clavipes]|nr:hypothetical protein TNCV_2117031 [Trichonephila clavipes]